MGKFLYFLLALGWTAFISYASLSSFKDIDTGFSFFSFPHADKLIHAGFYFVCSLVWYLLLNKGINSPLVSVKAIQIAALFSIFYGVLIELLQHYCTTDRHGDWLDALANTTGVLLAVMLILNKDRLKATLKIRK